MDNLPPLSICLVTYKRTEMAVKTIRSTIENLDYPKELRSWFVYDDGSAPEHNQAIREALKDEQVKHYISERMRPAGKEDTYDCGMGWNKILGLAHQNSDFVLWIEDDWNLDEKLDLKPFIKLLTENEDVGIVSFRILSVGADVHTVGYDGIHYLQYARTTQYAYSGNPHLRHARFALSYGWFMEDCNPGDVELKQDDRYRLATEGPKIWRPLNISLWGAWKHEGTEKSWE